MTTKKNNKKKITFSKLEILLLIICLVIFSFLASLVVTDNIKWFDNAIYSIVSKMMCRPMTLFFKNITIVF